MIHTIQYKMKNKIKLDKTRQYRIIQFVTTIDNHPLDRVFIDNISVKLFCIFFFSFFLFSLYTINTNHLVIFFSNSVSTHFA